MLEAIFFNSLTRLTPGDQIIQTCRHYDLQIANTARLITSVTPSIMCVDYRNSAYLLHRLSNLICKIS
jgi:hypothetical protein